MEEYCALRGLQPIVIFGAGGHAGSVLDALQAGDGYRIAGVVDEIYHGWAHGSLWASDTSHTTRGSSYDRLVAELCADRDTLELVLEYTRPDYEFFGFPPPKICERSTGRERGSKWEDRAADL